MLITANTVANLVANLNANANSNDNNDNSNNNNNNNDNMNVNNNAGRSFFKERNYSYELDLEEHIFVKSNLEYLLKSDINLGE